MAKKWIEKRHRGVFGWIFLTLFWLWNALMAIGVWGGLSNNVEEYGKLSTEFDRTAYAAGTGIGVTMLLFLWCLGAVIFGLAAYFTRGKREMIEVEI